MSKGLELLKRHKKSMEDLLDNGTILPELYFVFKDELDIIEQALKALEIMDGHTVISTHGNYPKGKILVCVHTVMKVTKDQLDLLREVLK